MHKIIEEFQTRRLIAERIDRNDLLDLVRLRSDPRVGQTLGGTRKPLEVRKMLEAHIDHWDRYGYGIWCFREPESRRFVGRAGLRHISMDDRDEIELLYAYLPEYWGKGLGHEVAAELVRLAFDDLRLDQLISYTMTANFPSRKIIKKAGFQFEKEAMHAGLPHVYYRLTRKQYDQA